jgi:hypothetical protein
MIQSRITRQRRFIRCSRSFARAFPPTAMMMPATNTARRATIIPGRYVAARGCSQRPQDILSYWLGPRSLEPPSRGISALAHPSGPSEYLSLTSAACIHRKVDQRLFLFLSLGLARPPQRLFCILAKLISFCHGALPLKKPAPPALPTPPEPWPPANAASRSFRSACLISRRTSLV